MGQQESTPGYEEEEEEASVITEYIKKKTKAKKRPRLPVVEDSDESVSDIIIPESSRMVRVPELPSYESYKSSPIEPSLAERGLLPPPGK